MKNFFPMAVDRPDDYSPKELMVGGGLLDDKGKVNTAIYNQWLYRGVFSATEEAEGPGTTSSYSFPDIMTVAVIGCLRKFDIRLKKASRMANQVMEMLERWFRYKQNVKDEEWPTVYVGAGGKIEVSTNEIKGEVIMVINIYNIYCNVMGRLVEMNK